MQRVLVDACGWVALIDGGIHLDHALDPLFGRWELVVPDVVMEELDRLAASRSQPLLLELLRSRRERQPGDDATGHADDVLLSLATAHAWPVLTVDKRLKHRLQQARGAVLSPTKDRRLTLLN